MNSICYLLKKSILNTIKKGLKKPGTYFFIILVPLYLISVAFSFTMMLQDSELRSPEGLAFILSAISLFTLPTNLLSYAKKKGLIFTSSDVHMLFQTPISPKMVLVYAAIRNFTISTLLTLILAIASVGMFQLPIYKAILFFFVSGIVETIAEICFMIALYGNELFSEKVITAIRIGIFAVLGAFVLIAFLIIYQNGSLSAIFDVFQHPYIQCVPLLGWYIAFIHCLIAGPTVTNVIFTACYVLLAAFIIIYAIKMPCTGLYYEDAMKFADDYTEARKRAKKGETARVGQKKKFKKNATVSYKGNFAKAIFYRQLLEYKKNRFFIFGLNTIFSLIIGVLIAIFMRPMLNDPEAFDNPEFVISTARYFIIPGISMYLMMIFSGFSSKWQKELECAYTFLIPDSGIKKLFYSTLMEHIRILVDGALLVFPCSFALQFNILEAILMLLVYYLLQINKLYVEVLVESLLRAVFGATGRSVVRLVFISVCFAGGAILTAATVVFTGSAVMGLLAGCLFYVLITVAIASIGAIRYERMEMAE